MERKTKLKASALLTILICSIGATILLESYLAGASKSSYDPEYMTVSGVLSTDSYVLFPFAKKNLTIGFSKYGEMIDGQIKVGLNYGDEEDAFAPGEAKVTEAQWVEGWVINITYVEGGYYRNTWARATYSDYYDASGIGGTWKEGCTDGSSGLVNRGGRKTSGGAVTEPIKVLYNGPRRFVALLKTALYKDTGHAIPLVNITFTIVFNKDKKQVIIFKDIKRTDIGKNIGDMQIEFSNRGEWDLGAGTPPKSYAHFYENQTTLYNHHYQAWYNTALANWNGTFDVCQLIDDELNYAAWAAFWPKPILSWVGATQEEANREVILHSMSTKTEARNLTQSTQDFTLVEEPVAYPQKNATGIYWKEEPMVFVDDAHKVVNGSNPSSSVYYFEGNNSLRFPSGYVPGQYSVVKIVYKYKPNRDDMNAEPNSPFVIGEWDFKMYQSTDMFRGVTVYGTTDLHDGEDSDHAGSNYIDSEVQYYLNETFNPYDLYSAVHKQESRWVEISTLTSAMSYVDLTRGLDDHIYYVNASSELTRLGWTQPNWTGYYFRNNTNYAYGDWVNIFEDGTSYVHRKNWAAFMNATYQSGRQSENDQEEMLKITPTNYGPLGSLRFSDLVDFSFWYKTTYDSGDSTHQAPGIEIKLYNQSNGAYFASLKQFDNYNASTSWLHYTLNNIDYYLHTGYTADNAFYISSGATILKDSDGNTITTGAGGAHSYEWWNKRLRDFYVAYVAVDLWNGAAYVDDVDIAYLDRTSGIRYQRVYNMEEDKLVPSDWNAYCSFAERVLVNGTLIDRYPYHLLTNNVTGGYAPYYRINFENGNITFYYWVSGTGYTTWTLGIGTRIKVLYSTIEENEKGRYEWIIVGKDAATIDSIGAGYVTEAFDSLKDIDVQVAGMDVNDTRYGPLAPWVMSGPSTSGNRADYRDSLSRPHLKDDWCTNIPIASSNMIFEGGPIAQLGTEYFNEFTDIFFASGAYVINNTGQSNKIMALSCWARNSTASGYATIGVYKDLNGTIGLVIWGFDGQDTYYASKWLWDGLGGTAGIVYLQGENRGVTSIMLKITYPTLDPTHPTVTIVERCGTVSEKDQHDP